MKLEAKTNVAKSTTSEAEKRAGNIRQEIAQA